MEVQKAGIANLGLHDREYFIPFSTQLFYLLRFFFFSEREALRWIQKYIGAFGGDPTKVTMYVHSVHSQPLPSFHFSWGQSAGSISTSYHLVV
jgi:hypothetical protein